jgi:hypothetical protein
MNSVRASGKSKNCTYRNRRPEVDVPFSFFFFVLVYYERRTWSVGQADGADGVDGRAMPGPRSWMAFGADTQSGQINFTARRNNVNGGVRLEMSA